MSRIQTLFLLLVLCAGNSESWFFIRNEATQSPTETTPAGTSSTATTPGATTGAMVTANKTEEEEEDDDLSGAGEEIPNGASGIHKFVEFWDATTRTTGRVTEKAETNLSATGNANGLRGGRVEGGSGSHVESEMMLLSEIRGTVESASDSSPKPADSRIKATHPLCLPVPSDWPICSGKRAKSFTLPNILNHTSVEQVGAVLTEWAWLARNGCHHSAEWFLCLLLVPGCPAHSALPCRSFCQTLQDSCWASLENGRLPVECHLLPEGAPERGHPSCVSVSNRKGNANGSECFLFGKSFRTRHVC